MTEVKKEEQIEEVAKEKKEEDVEEEGEEKETGAKGVKKELKYTYWVDDKNKSRELPEEHKPKKIAPPCVVEEKPALNAPSQWNKLGSWEERAISPKELSQRVTQALKQWITQKECELVLTQVELQGEFKRIFSNNKRKVLYQISGKIKFEGDDLHIKLQQFTCTGDQQYSVNGKKKQQRQKLKSASSKMVGVVIETFNRYKQ